MRKYLTQHSFNAFTICLSREFVIDNNTSVSLEKHNILDGDKILFNRFANFIQANSEKGLDNLPLFNFLTTFYNVKFIQESDGLYEFKLILNENLNQSVSSRLKHTIFNQYNALIGFSEVLKEVEELDDTDRLVIERINQNARDLFKSIKLQSDFEQIKDYNFILDSRLAPPIEYLQSYLRHRQNKKDLVFEYNASELENVELNIDTEYFKISLDLFFNIFNEIVDLPKGNLKLEINQNCYFIYESGKDSVKDDDIIREIKLFNDFFEQGINIKDINNRVFNILFIRMIAEKLGGEFSLKLNSSADLGIVAKWAFPFVFTESQTSSNIANNAINNIDENIKSQDAKEKLPIELRNEIAEHFSKVEGTFVLDDWKAFADKLHIICLNYNDFDVNELKEIVQNIIIAIETFDVTALQRIMAKLKHISKIV